MSPRNCYTLKNVRVKIAIVSKYGIEDVYISIKEALKHAGLALSTEVDILWVDAETFETNDLSDVDGILVPGGFGIRGIEGKIRAIEYARTHKKPYLGLCLGFQLAVIEFARHAAGLKDATSDEISKEEGTHVIAILPEQEDVKDLGGTMRLGDYHINLKTGTKIYDLYGSTDVVERHRHRYEVNPEYIETIENAGLKFTGTCGNRMEVCEIPGDVFFLGTQFHPEFKSRPTQPSPPYVGFVRACRENRIKSQD